MAKANAKMLMLVDDEPAQRRLVGAIAARAGWRLFSPNPTWPRVPPWAPKKACCSMRC